MEREHTARAQRPDVPAVRPRGAEHPLHTIQRAAGNRAVARLVQRLDDDGAAAPDELHPLDDTEVAAALEFYRVQPRLYTDTVIGELRTRLGLEADGGIAEDLAQAVARYQMTEGSAGPGNSPSLRIDGKAGPRSLPRLFPSGLNAEGAPEEFAEAAQSQVIDRWTELDTPEARSELLLQLVNERLAAAGVPAVGRSLDAGASPNEKGSVVLATWTMRVGRAALAVADLDRDAAASLVDTFYHEARHAEQWFRMAQLRASQHRTAGAIATEMTIPRRIAAAAVAAPLEPGSMLAVIAQGWWDSVHGDFSAHRDATLAEVSAADRALTAARARQDAHPSAANQAALDRAQARFERAHGNYTNLPEENDAWATGPRAAAAVTAGTPTTVGPGVEDLVPSDDGLATDGAAAPVDEPEVAPPTIDGPLHDTLPEVAPA